MYIYNYVHLIVNLFYLFSIMNLIIRKLNKH